VVKTFFTSFLLSWVIVGSALPSLAQLPDPNRERFTQPGSEPELLPPEDQQPQLPRPAQPPSQPNPVNSTPQVEVRRIEVTGNTVLSADRINPIIQPLEGRSVSLQDLQAAAQRITDLYVTAGYITSRAIVEPQDIQNGVVQIRVVEGSISDIQIEGNQRLRSKYIHDRLRLSTESPVSVNAIEERLRLLQADPLLDSITATLQPGEGLGQSHLVVNLTEADAFQIGANVDNYTTPTTGSIRAGVSIDHLNLTGNGDRFSFSFNGSTTGGSRVFDTSYTLPVNARDGTVQLRTIIDRNDITESPFDVLNISGASERYEVSFRQPIVESLAQEFALSLGFSHQRSQDFLNDRGFPFFQGAERDGTSQTSVVKFGQDYLHRDPQGVWLLRSQFNFGTGLFDATVNDSPLPDGLFFSWLFQTQRLQRLTPNHLLVFQGDLQLTPDSLLPSEKFVIGGAQSLRGYRQSARSGDNGFRVSLEDRITVLRHSDRSAAFQVIPFVDFGSVWNQPDNPNRLADDRFLIGSGLGLEWQPLQDLKVRVDYGVPIFNIAGRGDDLQDDGFYFGLNYTH
jgi:hemolysin activation/secretion protein